MSGLVTPRIKRKDVLNKNEKKQLEEVEAKTPGFDLPYKKSSVKKG
jgi:hypothetical protein